MVDGIPSRLVFSISALGLSDELCSQVAFSLRLRAGDSARSSTLPVYEQRWIRCYTNLIDL